LYEASHASLVFIGIADSGAQQAALRERSDGLADDEVIDDAAVDLAEQLAQSGPPIWM
jgi:hypothetical protein